MNKLFLTILFSLLLCLSYAQQNHFVYIQTYNNQPFYLRLEGKVLSSSSTGYLIIPKLSDGDYRLIIGFAKNEWPEQNFSVNVKGNTGYELKNFGDKGWGLYDLQNAQVIMGGNLNVASANNNPSSPKKADPFADMLSNVVKDSTIRIDDTSAKTQEGTKNNVEEEKKIISNPDSLITASASILYSDIKKTMENNSLNGLERIYIDKNGLNTDTIRIIIPAGVENNEVVEEKKHLPLIGDKEIKNQDIVVKGKPSDVKTNADNSGSPSPKFIDDEPKKAELPERKVKADNKNLERSGALTMVNSDCHSIASEEDFFKLRKRMASEKADDNMIKIAKKALKAKCYNTAFIKNLSVLFLTDQGRYNFFDIAYPFVNDSANFPSLEKELSEEYYITRFRAMIHK